MIAARHAAWCIHLAETMRRSGQLSDARGLAKLEAEHPNLRAALAWLLDQGEVSAAQHLAGQLAEFWLRHDHFAEGQAWLERVLAVDRGEATRTRVDALVGLSMLQWPRLELTRAADLLAEAEAIARSVGDVGALAYARLHQGYVAVFAGDFALAVARGEETLTTCQAIPQEFSCHGALWLLARARLARGEDEQAAALYARLLASGRASGDQISIANGLVGQAILAERRGELDRALAGYVEAALVCREFGDPLFVSHCLNLVATAIATRRPDAAVRLFAAVGTLQAAVGAVAGPGLHLEPYRHEQARATALAALGAERFAAAQAAGTALTLDEAIAEAAALAGLKMSPVEHRPAASSVLTSREQDILRYVARGWSDKEIATALGISRRTVSNHVAAIRNKLDVPSRAAAVAAAMREGLV
jgi:non-specific serine/threonine protein kinase